MNNVVDIKIFLSATYVRINRSVSGPPMPFSIYAGSYVPTQVYPLYIHSIDSISVHCRIWMIFRIRSFVDVSHLCNSCRIAWSMADDGSRYSSANI